MEESWASSPAAPTAMQGNRGLETQAELAVRHRARAGAAYRVNERPEPQIRRTADLLFTRARVAVFIDGSFWHGCPAHFKMPATNTDFWDAKIDGNRQRDAHMPAALEGRGWIVLRFWEHKPPCR